MRLIPLTLGRFSGSCLRPHHLPEKIAGMSPLIQIGLGAWLALFRTLQALDLVNLACGINERFTNKRSAYTNTRRA
jgi:hypothetical protein